MENGKYDLEISYEKFDTAIKEVEEYLLSLKSPGAVYIDIQELLTSIPAPNQLCWKRFKNNWKIGISYNGNVRSLTEVSIKDRVLLAKHIPNLVKAVKMECVNIISKLDYAASQIMSATPKKPEQKREGIIG